MAKYAAAFFKNSRSISAILSCCFFSTHHALQGRRYRVVYNSSSLIGQIAAVESGLAVAVFTQCSAPQHLEILGAEHGLGPLAPMEASVYRSRASLNSKAVDHLYELLIKTLRQSITY